MPPNKECSVIIDGLYHDAPLSTVINVCGACEKKKDCKDYQWAETKLGPAEPKEEPIFISELRKSGYKFGKADHGWKPKGRNII